MEMTIFLAQIWGPLLLATALGILMSHNHYIRVYRDLQREPLALLIFGMAAMAVGIVQVGVHNLWDTFPEVVVSLLGWGLLLKGLMFIIAPRWVDKKGDGWVKLKMIPLAGTAMLILGIYLTWLAYF